VHKTHFRSLQSINALEFFMSRMGYALLPSDRRTGDLAVDAQRVFSTSHPMYPKVASAATSNAGKSKAPALRSAESKPARFALVKFVITPSWIACTNYMDASLGFRRDVPFREAVITALCEGDPFLAIAFSKATMSPADLYMTYDPRAVVVCAPKSYETVDFTSHKDWPAAAFGKSAGTLKQISANPIMECLANG